MFLDLVDLVLLLPLPVTVSSNISIFILSRSKSGIFHFKITQIKLIDLSILIAGPPHGARDIQRKDLCENKIYNF